MKTTFGWVLTGLGVVAVGYLGWFIYDVTTYFYPWYDFIPFFITYPVPLNWVNICAPLIAGVLLLVFGIRGLTKKARARA